MVVGDGDGVVDGSTISAEPTAYGLQPFYDFGLQDTFCRGSYAQHEVSALGDDFDEGVDDVLRSLPPRSRHPAPVVAEWYAALPGVWQLEIGRAHV